MTTTATASVIRPCRPGTAAGATWPPGRGNESGSSNMRAPSHRGHGPRHRGNNAADTKGRKRRADVGRDSPDARAGWTPGQVRALVVGDEPPFPAGWL
jgi:hypothetical protein